MNGTCKKERGAKRELTGSQPSDCASSIVVIFFSRIAPRMNNSEDLVPVYVQPLTTSFPRPPDRGATFHIPQSLRIFVSRRLRSLLIRSFVQRPAQLLHRPFHPLRGSFAYLNARAIRYSSFDLSFALVSDARFSRESLDGIGPVWPASANSSRLDVIRYRCGI